MLQPLLEGPVRTFHIHAQHIPPLGHKLCTTAVVHHPRNNPKNHPGSLSFSGGIACAVAGSVAVAWRWCLLLAVIFNVENKYKLKQSKWEAGAPWLEIKNIFSAAMCAWAEGLNIKLLFADVVICILPTRSAVPRVRAELDKYYPRNVFNPDPSLRPPISNLQPSRGTAAGSLPCVRKIGYSLRAVKMALLFINSVSNGNCNADFKAASSDFAFDRRSNSTQPASQQPSNFVYDPPSGRASTMSAAASPSSSWSSCSSQNCQIYGQRQFRVASRRCYYGWWYPYKLPRRESISHFTYCLTGDRRHSGCLRIWLFLAYKELRDFVL